MDQSKMMTMMIIKVEDIHARVRIANHHPVAANTVWERTIPDPQILCIIEGLFQYQEQNQSALSLSPGDFLFIEPNVRHCFFIEPTAKAGRIAGMHLEFTSAGTWAAGDYRLEMSPRRVTRVEDPLYLQNRLIHLAAVYESYHPLRKELVSAIAAEIILSLSPYWKDSVLRAARPSPRMEMILAYIRENLSTPLTRHSLAETFSLSAGYLNQLFKLEFGMSPSAVINRERVARAYQLINQEGLSVAEAALAVGFQDPFYFSRVFKQIYSIPPSQVAAKK
jgi:AraC-like DNA-binding protein